jgi:CheY-like chemotaxis protein
VLYVEDEETDVVLMRHAWKKVGLPNPLHVVHDGEQAIQYLRGEGEFSNRTAHPLPSLVLLDLKLPKVSGLEVLEWIRAQESLHTLQVVMLSSSNQPTDIHKAHALHANAYLIKPSNPTDLAELMVCIRDFWLIRAQVPPECSQFGE